MTYLRAPHTNKARASNENLLGSARNAASPDDLRTDAKAAGLKSGCHFARMDTSVPDVGNVARE